MDKETGGMEARGECSKAAQKKLRLQVKMAAAKEN